MNGAFSRLWGGTLYQWCSATTSKHDGTIWQPKIRSPKSTMHSNPSAMTRQILLVCHDTTRRPANISFRKKMGGEKPRKSIASPPATLMDVHKENDRFGFSNTDGRPCLANSRPTLADSRPTLNQWHYNAPERGWRRFRLGIFPLMFLRKRWLRSRWISSSVLLQRWHGSGPASMSGRASTSLLSWLIFEKEESKRQSSLGLNRTIETDGTRRHQTMQIGGADSGHNNHCIYHQYGSRENIVHLFNSLVLQVERRLLCKSYSAAKIKSRLKI